MTDDLQAIIELCEQDPDLNIIVTTQGIDVNLAEKYIQVVKLAIYPQKPTISISTLQAILEKVTRRHEHVFGVKNFRQDNHYLYLGSAQIVETLGSCEFYWLSEETKKQLEGRIGGACATSDSTIRKLMRSIEIKIYPTKYFAKDGQGVCGNGSIKKIDLIQYREIFE